MTKRAADLLRSSADVYKTLRSVGAREVLCSPYTS
jgi:hypothetical protein